MSQLFEQLGLSWVSMLIYLGMLLLFVIAFTYILVKPVRKIVEERKAKLDSAFEENRRLNAESIAAKKEYEFKLHEVKQEVAKLSEETLKNTEKKREQIIADAEAKAQSILDGAQHELEAERERLSQTYKKDVSELALGIAGAVLQREVAEKDNKKVIDEALEKWAK